MNRSTSIRKKLNGPIFSIILPFDKNENIDYVQLKKYLNFLFFNGARNFYLMVYNSRLSLLSENEIKKVNIFCIKQVKKLSKKNLLFVQNLIIVLLSKV